MRGILSKRENKEGYNPLHELILALGSAPEQEAMKESEATR